ncbi:MAG: hypothetical protein JOZ77_02085 [Candidatus Eremiobacteraeota bacterium]|nr:hypothetical protein [Candidatus Eremiobacteraeota bacterium]
MKQLLVVITALCASFIPALADGASGAMSVGAGPNGYDWLIGTWSCRNTLAASKLGALPSTSLTVTRVKDGSGLVVHTTSPNGDVTVYYAYVPSTKTWFSPFVDSGGNYGYESTQQSGRTIRWTGTFYLTNGSATPIRDTFTMLGMAKQYDLSEASVHGAWTTVAKTTCTKS